MFTNTVRLLWQPRYFPRKLVSSRPPPSPPLLSSSSSSLSSSSLYDSLFPASPSPKMKKKRKNSKKRKSSVLPLPRQPMGVSTSDAVGEFKAPLPVRQSHPAISTLAISGSSSTLPPSPTKEAPQHEKEPLLEKDSCGGTSESHDIMDRVWWYLQALQDVCHTSAVPRSRSLSSARGDTREMFSCASSDRPSNVRLPTRSASPSSVPDPVRWYALCFQAKQQVLSLFRTSFPLPFTPSSSSFMSEETSGIGSVPVATFGSPSAREHGGPPASATLPSEREMSKETFPSFPNTSTDRRGSFAVQEENRKLSAEVSASSLSPFSPCSLRVVSEEEMAAMYHDTPPTAHVVHIDTHVEGGPTCEERPTSDAQEVGFSPASFRDSTSIPLSSSSSFTSEETRDVSSSASQEEKTKASTRLPGWCSRRNMTALLSLYALVESEDGILLRQWMSLLPQIAKREPLRLDVSTTLPASTTTSSSSSVSVFVSTVKKVPIYGTVAEWLFVLSELKVIEESLLQCFIGEDLSLKSESNHTSHPSTPHETSTAASSLLTHHASEDANPWHHSTTVPESEAAPACSSSVSGRTSLLRHELPQYTEVLQVFMSGVALHRLGLHLHPAFAATVRQFRRLQWSRTSDLGQFAYAMAQERKARGLHPSSSSPRPRSSPSSLLSSPDARRRDRAQEEVEGIALRSLPSLRFSLMCTAGLSPLAVEALLEQEALLHAVLLSPSPEPHVSQKKTKREGEVRNVNSILPVSLQYDISLFPLLVEWLDALALSACRSAGCVQCVADLLALNVVRYLMHVQAVEAQEPVRKESTAMKKWKTIVGDEGQNAPEETPSQHPASKKKREEVREVVHGRTLWPVIPLLHAPVMRHPTSTPTPTPITSSASSYSLHVQAKIISHLLRTAVHRTEQMEIPQPLLATVLQLVLPLTKKGILTDGGEDVSATGVESCRLAFYDHVTADLIKINRAD